MNLTNLDEFSYTRFVSILERFQAPQLIQANYSAFLDAYAACKRAGVSSLLFKFGEIFSEPPKAAESEPVKALESEPPKAVAAGSILYGSPDFIGRILDAAIYFRDNATFATEEIRMAVENKALFPVRLLYRTEEGGQKLARPLRIAALLVLFVLVQ